MKFFFQLSQNFFPTKFIVVFAGFILTCLVLILYLFEPIFFHYIDNKVYDTMINMAEKTQPHKTPVIVDIDEKSLSKIGQWPWPRYRVAQLLEKISSLNATCIGVDILFAEPDRTSLNEIKSKLYKDLNISLKISGISSEMMDNDAILAKLLEKGPFSIGYYMSFEPATALSNIMPPSLDPLIQAPAESQEPTKYLINANTIVTPLPIFMHSARAAGFFNSDSDVDGVLRKIPLIMAYKNKIYPSLAISSLLQ